MPELTVGVISDTHGLLRPQAIDALRGCDLIIHAGDVGNPGVIKALDGIAPTFAVRGNIDHGDWAAALPATRVVEIGELHFFVLHDIAELDLDPAAADFQPWCSAIPTCLPSRRVRECCFSTPAVPVRAASSCR